MNFDGGEKRKRGRPVGKDGGKKTKITIRLTEMESSALHEAVELSGKSQTDIVRAGLKAQLNLIKYRK